MGEGLYRSDDGRTAYAEPYDELDPNDSGPSGTMRYDDSHRDDPQSGLFDAWEPVDREVARISTEPHRSA